MLEYAYIHHAAYGRSVEIAISCKIVFNDRLCLEIIQYLRDDVMCAQYRMQFYQQRCRDIYLALRVGRDWINVDLISK